MPKWCNACPVRTVKITTLEKRGSVTELTLASGMASYKPMNIGFIYAITIINKYTVLF